MKRELKRRDSIARRIEKLPINAVHRSTAQANFAAAEAAVDRIARAVVLLHTFLESTGTAIAHPRRQH
jgi:hypothetical protein